MELSDHLKGPAVVRLSVAILLCVIVGSLGSLITFTGPGSWFALLTKPVFQPPNWIFAPVWTLLFVLMGMSLYLVWSSGTDRKDVKIALGIFGVQFILNILWSFLFFGMQSPFLGLADILLLWILIITTIVLFYRIEKGAAYLLIPYILWVSFALYLNYTIWILNP